MDASKLTEMRMQAANTYKSNWQPRDASEVTYKRQQAANALAYITHKPTVYDQCTDGSCAPPRTHGGFSTDYSASIVFQKAAGCPQCTDPNWGAPGGHELLTCNEVAQILYVPPNPVKGEKCCVDNGKKNNIYPGCDQLKPAYTGANRNIPTDGKGVPNVYKFGPLDYHPY